MQIFKKIKDLITDNYRKDMKSNVGKLQHIVSRELNLIKMTLQHIEEWRDIDKAPGSTLDLIGRNLREPRSNRSDEEYRGYISTKTAANKSSGDIQTLNEVCQTFYGDHYLGAKELWNEPSYNNEPAAFKISLSQHSHATLPAPNIERVAAGGIRIAWETVLDEENIFIDSDVEIHTFRNCRCGAFNANGCFGGSKFRRGR